MQATVRRRRSSAAFTVVVVLVMLVCAVGMGSLLLLSGAPTALVTGVVLASVPVAPLVAAYLWLDRYEPEPTGRLGAVVAGGVG